jgi:hypothetical protein
MVSFYLAWHMAAAFVLAGLWISTATLLAERLGSRLGGLIANLPSNILISFIFITLTQSPDFTARAARAVPLGMTIDTLFVLVFVLASRRGTGAAVLASLACWFALAFSARWLRSVEGSVMTVVYVLVVLLTLGLLERLPGRSEKTAAASPYSLSQLLQRALFAGSVVSGAVAVARLAGPFWAGIFSTFPAVLLSSLVILSVKAGPAFARATGKVLVLSSSNIVVFALVTEHVLPDLGLGLGLAAAFAASALWVAGLYPFMRFLR